MTSVANTAPTTPTTNEKQHQSTDDRLRSPFQLHKSREKTVKLISLSPTHLTKNGPTNFDVSASSVSSVTSSSVESVESLQSQGSSIGSCSSTTSPFSLNFKKISTSLSSSTLGGISSGSIYSSSSASSLTTLSPNDKIADLQKEIVLLKKDIESKDAKLSSSVKSIKQFWSPELKKERALRKEETEKYLLSKDKNQIAQTEIEEYKSTLQDLESEFKSQQTTIKSLNEKLLNSTQKQTSIEPSQERELVRLKVQIQALKKEKESQEKERETKRSFDEAKISQQLKEIGKLKEDLQALKRDKDTQEQQFREEREAKKSIDDEKTTKHLEEIKQLKEEIQALKKDKESQGEELEKERAVNKSLDAQLQNQTEIERLNEVINTLKLENKKTENETEDLLQSLRTEREKQDSEILILNRTLDDFEVKYGQLEDELEDRQRCISDLEIILVENEKREEEYIAEHKELELLHNTLQEQEIDYQMIKKEYDTLKKVHSECSNDFVDSEDLECLKTTISDLEKELNQKQDQCDRLLTEDTKLREIQTEHLNTIKALENSVSEKEKEKDKVHSELLRLHEKLESSEKDMLRLQHELKNNKSQDLFTSDVIVQKDKEIMNLNSKYEKLDKYLTERENALELCRDELKGIKTMNQELRIEKENLQNQIFEQKSNSERLEKQLRSFSRPKEDVALVAAHNELKAKYDAMITENASLKKEVEKSCEKCTEKNQVIDKLEENIKLETEKLDKLSTEIERLENENKELSDELDQKNEELEAAVSNKLAEEEAINIEKANTNKKMMDELTEKDNCIEELERQLKEKTKQIISLKKSQTGERDKQQQILNESKKLEREIESIQEDKEKLEKRILMLEDALRESVSLAVEREDLLAGHKEMYEDAVNKMKEYESEYQRVEMEKAITNIKNSFLILSLSEKDALIASMEATKKRNMEELLNIKQESLLNSITEKDNQIAQMELHSPKNKKQEIKLLKTEKEKFVEELKQQNNMRVALYSNSDKNLLINELKDAPPEQIYEAIRHLSTSTNKLEFYIEEFVSFLHDDEKSLNNLPELPRKSLRSSEKLKKLSKNELLKELEVVDYDSAQLKKYVNNLLDELEGVS